MFVYQRVGGINHSQMIFKGVVYDCVYYCFTHIIPLINYSSPQLLKTKWNDPKDSSWVTRMGCQIASPNPHVENIYIYIYIYITHTYTSVCIYIYNMYIYMYVYIDI